jgi:hypothetical protein
MPKQCPVFEETALRKEAFAMFLVSLRFGRLSTLLCLLAAIQHSISEGAEPKSGNDDKNAAAVRKRIEKTLQRGKGDFFVVALIETHFDQDVRTMPGGGTVIHLGRFIPVSTAKVRVIQGQNAAVDAILEHLGKFGQPVNVRTKPGRDSSISPKTNWRLMRRFEDADKADKAMRAAQAAYDKEIQPDGLPSASHKVPE